MLRSGRRSSRTTSTSTASRRAPTCCAPLGDAIAAAVREHEPRRRPARRRPSSAPSPLAAAASLETGLPFLIVRKEAKDYGTANRLEGVFEPGERVCLVEDVVTSGGAALEAVEALREAGSACLQRDLRRRPRRGRRRRARAACRAAPAAASAPPSCSNSAPQIRMVERYPTGVVRVLRQGLIHRHPNAGGRL